MKPLFLVLSLLSMTAHANYQCSNGEGVWLTVQKAASPVGDTLLTLQSSKEIGVSRYYGKSTETGGVLMKKTVVELDPFDGKHSLTIVSRPHFCGRGSCDPEAKPWISAKLELDGTGLDFQCELVP